MSIRQASYLSHFLQPLKIAEPMPFGPETYPELMETVTYSEDIYVGYRWFSCRILPPMYAFGHGLSYTSYEYSDAGTDDFVYSPGDKVKVSVQCEEHGNT